MTNSSTIENDKKTPLFAEHQKLSGKIVSFGGWAMPVSYESVVEEHKTVREKVGLFDVSHMGEIFVSGTDALKFLQLLTINDVSKLNTGTGQYTAMCNEQGGMIDDLIIYRVDNEKYLLCVNAANSDKDFAWIQKILKANPDHKITIENLSELWSQLAVQGPACLEALKGLVDTPSEYGKIENLAYTNICIVDLFNAQAYIARTGYTGEKGFELYVPNQIAVKCWQALLADKENTGIKPIGLGARDTLRLEACYLLYGNDMDDSVSPLEAGISWATKLQKDQFIGKSPLVEQKELGVPRSMYAFKLEEKGIARHGMEVYFNQEKIGVVTSGSILPTLGGAGGMALLTSNKVKTGDKIEIDIRGKRKTAAIMKRPLYSAKAKD